jgi:glycosyltransferase involved in cell wall biosynthesis
MTAKIVHLIGQLRRGGAERQLIHLAGCLAERGWSQAVISFGGGNAWNDRVVAMGVPLYEIPRTAFKPWRLWKLSRILQRERPDILQAWSPHVAQYARWAWGKRNAKTIFGVRIDLTVNGNTGEPMDKLQFTSALVHADIAVSNSKSALDRLAERGVALSRTAVIYNIVNPQYFANPAEPAAAPRIIAVGSLIPRKGYDCLLQAAGILAARKRRFELLLIGGGPERDHLKSLASQLGLQECVQFMDATDEVPSLLATAHIMAHPSKREGLSNTILEGMAARLPVVATTDCASEIIEDGRTGLLVPAANPQVLADALERLLRDPELRAALGEAAQKHVETQCNAARITSQYEDVYNSLTS